MGFRRSDEVARLSPLFDPLRVVDGKGMPDLGQGESGVDVDKGARFEMRSQVVPVDFAGVFFELFERGGRVVPEDAVAEAIRGTFASLAVW